MRVPDSTAYVRFLSDLQSTQAQMLDAQTKVSSGKKVNSPSDNPAAAADIVRLSGEKAAADQFGKNIDSARSRLSIADSTLDNVEQMLERIRVLGLSALGNKSGASASVAEVSGLGDQIMSSANVTSQGRYIFGGSATTAAPYVKAANSTISYQGNSNAVMLQVGPDTTLQAQIPGSEVFTGAVDVFDTISNLVTAMNAGDQTAIAAQVKNLEQVSAQVSTARTRIGGYVNTADSLTSQLSAAGLSRAQELNDVQAVDQAEAITQLTLSQSSLQATLAVGARIAQLSLLDYLK